MPMAHGLPLLPSGVVLDGDEVLWFDKFVAGEWVTYQSTTAEVLAALGGGAQLGVANVFTKNQSVAPVALVDGANIAVDAAESNNFTVTLGGDRQLDNPSNLTDGMVLSFVVTQDGTGGRVLTFDTLYKWAGGVVPTFVTTAGAVNYISAQYDAGNGILICAALVGLA